MTGLLCSLPLVAGLFAACSQDLPIATGYVEGEFALIAAEDTARIAEISVRRGDRLQKGAVIARQEQRDAELALAEAVASEAQARARLRDLEEGRRPQEIAVIEATLASARAQLAETQRRLDRMSSLRDRGFAAQSEAENAATALNVATAKVGELQAQLDVARLPARPSEINAARFAVEKAEAARQSAQWRLDERVIRAPADGTVFDLILRPGETAGPSMPVVSFLPSGATRLKLYVAEKLRSGIAPGTRLSVHCDGCADDQFATVSWVSDEPEYTPPVIYSVAIRQKLVYLVEARPEAGASSLRPGQIVDVAIAEAAR